MIRRIYIKDFILIKELELSLPIGFTSITGETGAGKSILVGAIGLILGNRADSKAIREGANKSIIEADFDVSQIKGLRELFEECELDYEPICTMRRELTSNGKSRAFINDTPTTTTVMKRVGERLVDIHSQHHNMLIGDEEFQMGVLDTLAGNQSLLLEYQEAFKVYQETKRALASERKRIEEQRKEQDYIAFQYEQLDEAKLKEGELQQLEERQAIAQHAHEIAEALSQLSGFGEGDDQFPSILSQLHNTNRMLERVSEHYGQVAEIYERLLSVEVELHELIREADGIKDNLDVDTVELEQIEARLDFIQSLLYKHNLSSMGELIELRNRYEAQLEEINNSDETLRELERKLAGQLEHATELAAKLSKTRSLSAKELLHPLHELMEELGIAGAKFEVELKPSAQLIDSGHDTVQFLFATNKQTKLQPIREIASGGEISRFMLALKSILAEHTVLPTVIFDEIDTGVSGEVAEKLGRVMLRLSQHIQVLSITHLPQIAALAESQFVVAKEEESDGFFTSIREVSGEKRVHHLASMLSGAEKTDAALANARELLGLKKK